MDSIASVRDMPFYADLLQECLKVREHMRKAYWDLVLGYYRLGCSVARVFTPEYGQATMIALSQDVGIGVSNLYRAMQFAEHRSFPTEEALRSFKAQCEQQGVIVTWTYIRTHILPESTSRPDMHGGVEHVAEEMMGKVESLAQGVDNLKEMLSREDLQPDTKEQVVGVILNAREVMERAAVVAEPTFSPPAEISTGTAFRILRLLVQYFESTTSLECLCDELHADGDVIMQLGESVLTVVYAWCGKQGWQVSSEGELRITEGVSDG